VIPPRFGEGSAAGASVSAKRPAMWALISEGLFEAEIADLPG
jgi:hypothetical protein